MLQQLISDLLKRDIFNLLVFLSCLIGFLYQASLAWEQYFEYNTVSVVKFEDNPIFEYPSVTLCLGEMIRDDTLQKWYPEYNCLINNPNCTSKTTLNRTELHRKYEELAFKEKPLLENLKTGFHLPQSDVEMLPLEFKEGRKTLRIKSHEIIKEIPSLSFELNSRCFTFFSQLNIGNKSRDWFRSKKLVRVRETFYKKRNFKERKAPETASMFAEIYNIWMGQSDYLYDDSVTPKKQPFFTIHAPDHIPGHERYQKLGAFSEVWYLIYFSRTVSHLLKAPYKTNCRDYDLGNEKVNQSQQECYQSCVLNWYRRECNCIPRVQFPLSSQNLKPDDRLCLDDGICYGMEMEEREITMISRCNSECLPNCKQQIYSFESVEYQHKKERNIFTLINRKEPDRVFIHSPEVTFDQFVCNLASLAGIWLNVGVFAIFDRVSDGFNFLLMKFFRPKVKQMKYGNYAKRHLNAMRFIYTMQYPNYQIGFNRRNYLEHIRWLD